MFDIGFLEMMTIGIVALIVIGPERLPEVAAKVGRYVGKAQRFVRGVKSDISRELETGDLKKLIGDQKDQLDELRTMVHTATKDIKSSTGEAFKDAEKSIGDMKSDFTEASSESRIDAKSVDDTNVKATTADAGSGSKNHVDVESEQLNKPDATDQVNANDESQSHSDKAS